MNFDPIYYSIASLGSLGWEDLLEKEMETHSSILAWRILFKDSLVEQPGRL